MHRLYKGITLTGENGYDGRDKEVQNGKTIFRVRLPGRNV